MAKQAPAGYSGTPLIKKLGITEGMAVVALNAPKYYSDLLGKLPDGAKTTSRLSKEASFIHLFTDKQSDLKKQLPSILKALKKGGIFWIPWPKKSSGIPTDITENDLRTIVLPTGLVDVKVCAVDEVWSGLKFVWRVEKR